MIIKRPLRNQKRRAGSIVHMCGISDDIYNALPSNRNAVSLKYNKFLFGVPRKANIHKRMDIVCYFLEAITSSATLRGTTA